MNILPFDIVVHTLSFIDSESVLQSMQINKFFACIINKIIKDAMRNDINYCLFRIKTLSIATLRKYLQQINDEAELPNLMLAAFLSNNKDIVPEIIDVHIKLQKITTLVTDLRACFNFCTGYFYRHNVFFNFIIGAGKDPAVIDFRNYFETWVILILNAEQIDVIDRMYPRDPIICETDQSNYAKKFDIFNHVYLNFNRLRSRSYHNPERNLNNCGIIAIDNYIKQMLYTGDNIIVHYRRNHSYTSEYMRKKIDSNIIYALYGGPDGALRGPDGALRGPDGALRGHLNLFLECLKYQNKQIQHYHKLVITCLLRYNHTEQYKAYSSMMRTDPHYRLVKRHIGFKNIFVNFPANIILPLLSLSTFEFCVQEFGLLPCIPKSAEYTNIASLECLEKYSVCNYSWSDHFSNDIFHEESMLDHCSCLLDNIVAQMVLTYPSEPDILAYCTENSFVNRGKNCIGDKNMNMWAYIALLGGHLELFRRIFPSQHLYYQVSYFNKTISIGLLRYNHIDQYQIIKVDLGEFTITIDDIFCTELYFGIDLPKLSVTTFKFLVQEFGVGIPAHNHLKYVDDELQLFLRASEFDLNKIQC